MDKFQQQKIKKLKKFCLLGVLVERPFYFRKLLQHCGRFHKWFCAPTPNFRALRPSFEKLFTGAKVRRKAQKMGAGCETFYEINPWM